MTLNREIRRNCRKCRQRNVRQIELEILILLNHHFFMNIESQPLRDL